jgi:hypothetical protein
MDEYEKHRIKKAPKLLTIFVYFFIPLASLSHSVYEMA